MAFEQGGAFLMVVHSIGVGAMSGATAPRRFLLNEQYLFRALTLGLFWFVVLSLLLYTGFLPYGTDGNETFSSILHAKNMYAHGIGSAFGLTNESTSPDPGVAPFVYTHQGNFPRLYALLLYALGARSAQAQILITTLTVGTAGIFFAHVYMERRVNSLFAFIFCSVLISDYVMSLQWFVNTWRVWHPFFFFATLLLAHAFADAGSSKRRTAAVCALLFINFACLFYLEFVFAMFVAIFFGLYLTFLLWRQPKRLVIGWAAAGFGSAFAIFILCLQIVAYLGWQGFLSDLGYTFFSRMASPGDLAAFRARVLEFMHEHNIVFWDNFVSAGSGLARPEEMLRLFFRFSLGPQTPALVLLSLLLTAGAWLHGGVSALRAGAGEADVQPWIQGRMTPEGAAALLVPAFVLFAVIVVLSGESYGITDQQHRLLVGSSIPFLSICLFLASAIVLLGSGVYRHLGAAKLPAASLAVTLALVGALQFHHIASPRISLVGFVLLLSVAAGAAATLWALLSHCTLTNGRVVLATAFLVAFAGFAHYHAWLYQPIHSDAAPSDYEAFWLVLIGRLGGQTFWKILILATAFLSTLIVLGRMDDAEGRRSLARLARIAPYWLIGTLAFAIVCTLAAGYVYTAYQVRYCPLAVYVSDLPIAGALYVLWRLATRFIGELTAMQRTASAGRTMFLAAPAAFVCGILVAVAGTWLALQATYLRGIPPNRAAAMFRALAELSGSSAVVSTYATPIAVQTGNWAYYDVAFFQSGAQFDGRSYHVSSQDFRYLWLGDWKSNSAYRTPQYFVCWLHLNLNNVVVPANRATCGGTFPGIKEIRAGNSIFDHKEVFRDEKYDLWSIVKLDWDYPPVLHPLAGSSPEARVRAAPVRQADGIGFAVETDPQQQEGRPVMGGRYKLYVETGDGVRCTPSALRLIQSSKNPAQLLLPKDFQGCAQIGVAPFTATKAGAEYRSEVVPIRENPTSAITDSPVGPVTDSPTRPAADHPIGTRDINSRRSRRGSN